MDTYFVMSDPRAKIVDGKISYSGDTIPVQFKYKMDIHFGILDQRVITYEEGGAIDLLIKAGVMKDPDKKVWKGSGLWFDSLDAYATCIEETVNQILELIEMPIGEEEWIVLKGKKEVPRDFRDCKNKGFIAVTNKNQQLLIAEKITREVLGKGKGKYAPMSTQKSHERVYSDKEFRKLMENYFIHNKENIFWSKGVSSIASCWISELGCFGATSYRPFASSSRGLAVFEKLPSTQERIDRQKI